MRGRPGAGLVGHAFSATDRLEPDVGDADDDDYDDYEVLLARRRARARAAEARDADGRRRFHGAFTGGFAAGYHNTCGSAEGWTPRAYRSTRGEHVAVPQTTLDDVMDDEDKATMMAEGLTARREFRLSSAVPDAAAGAFLTTADELAARSRGAGTGPVLRVAGFVVKNDVHGLGYRAPTGAGESLRELVPQQGGGDTAAAARRVTIGESLRSRCGHAGAFGMGALEELDGDIDDVYDQGSWDMYDREIGEPATKKRESTRPAPVCEEPPSREECVLPRFVRAQRQDSDVFRCWFPPPVVPPDYVPVHRFLKPVIALPEEIRNHMTPQMRARLLGEPTQTPPAAAPQPQPAPEVTASLLSIKFAPSSSTLSSTVTAPGLHTAVSFVRAQQRAAAAAPAPAPPKPQFVRATRETRTWAPARLLCKRLGVPVPYTTEALGTQPAPPAPEAAPTAAAVAAAAQPTGPAPPADQLPSELRDPDGAAAPALDLFRAIFDTPLVEPESKPPESKPSEPVPEPQPPEPAPEPEQKPPEPEEALPMLFPQPPPGFVPGAVRASANDGDAPHSRSSSRTHHRHHHHKHHHRHRHKHRSSEE